MGIDDERPEDELHTQRASELVALVAMVFSRTAGRLGSGEMPCPFCRRGLVAYAVTETDDPVPRRVVTAVCETAGCLTFRSLARGR